MKNSQLALRVFIGLITLLLLTIMTILHPMFIVAVVIIIISIYIFFALIDAQVNYNSFGKKWNIFYYISKWLDSLPQIIKDKK
jgi:hypothetical protein